MDIDSQIKHGHLFLTDRKCRTCGEVKNLIEEFYKTKKGMTASCYSYHCKECSVSRILKSRKNKKTLFDWQYPDW